jgi:hypothetical protein
VSCKVDLLVKERCPYCGSISSELFFQLASDGAEIIPTDKRDKYYIKTDDDQMLKYYTTHL